MHEKTGTGSRARHSVNAMLKLRDLEFVDLYVSLHSNQDSYYQIITPGEIAPQEKDLPEGYHDDVVSLRKQLEKAMESTSEVGINYDGMRLRASKIITSKDQTWVALRRIEELPPELASLGFAPAILNSLVELGKRDGLILICGATGQGKTTTASAMIYDYLMRYGSIAFTIEDPVEYQLEGRHGQSGLCYQVEAQNDEDWETLLKRSLRWHPRYIMVGEIRTPDAANQLLRAATSGHLVITTMHAGSLEEGLEGLLHLAEQAVGDHAPILLSTALTCVLHQQIQSNQLTTRIYVTASGNMGDPVRSLIRERKIGQIRTFTDQQMARQINKY